MSSQADIFAQGPNPKLVVFDLDYTVWPFDCDKDVIAPFSPSPYGGVYDRYGRPSNPFPDIPHIIAALVDAKIPIAYASRNPSANSVEQLLRAISIAPTTRPEVRSLWDALPSRDYFHAYSSAGQGRGKDRHFAAIKKATGIVFSDMLFFDDLHDNIVHAQKQGTTSVHLGRRGVTWAAMIAGIEGWRVRPQAPSPAPVPAPVPAPAPATVPALLLAEVPALLPAEVPALLPAHVQVLETIVETMPDSDTIEGDTEAETEAEDGEIVML